MHKETSLSLADMMSALMMVFMFISLAFLAELEKSEKTFTRELNKALHKEFNKDLYRWKAEITPNNVVRFRAPFTVGSAEIPDDFTDTLEQFCPRYVTLLAKANFSNKISEIRIEGHTSKGWNDQTSPEESFIKNMQLSQQRATSVLSYCYLLKNAAISKKRSWMETRFQASGLASSDPIYAGNIISNELSRRVDFIVIADKE